MPKCTSCNIRYKSSQLDSNGFCRACLSDIDKTLENNLKTLRDGRGEDELQRIFDAFVRSYPDALITGVGCNSERHHLLVYLDDAPMYLATFDPLRSSVNLEPYNTPAAAPAPVYPSPSAGDHYADLIADRGHTLSSAVAVLSVGFAFAALLSNYTIASMCFGGFSFLSLLGCLFKSGNFVILCGVLMAFAGLLGDSAFILPALLMIYGGMKF